MKTITDMIMPYIAFAGLVTIAAICLVALMAYALASAMADCYGEDEEEENENE